MNRPFYQSLSVKLTLAFLVIGFITLLLISVVVGRQTRRDFDNFVRDRATTNLADRLVGYYALSGSWSGVDRVVQLPRGEGDGPGGGPRQGKSQVTRQLDAAEATTIAGATGGNPVGIQITPQSQEINANPNAPGRAAMAISMRVPFTIVGPNGRVVYSASMTEGAQVDDEQIQSGIPLLVNDTNVGTLLIATRAPEPLPLDSDESSFINRMWRTLAWGSLGAFSIALIMGVIIAHTLTRPLRALTEATQDVARGNLGRQVDVQSKDEVGDLAAAFNHMSSDLENSVNLRRRMTADIAHDLRTPLSVILGYTEALDDGILPPSAETYAILHDEAKHLSRLVEDLRTLSLAEAGELRIYPQHFPPEELLTRATSAHKVQADQRGVTLSIDVAPYTPDVMVDPERMAQVLHNLVSNALRYTPKGGAIILSAAPAAGSGTSTGVDIMVKDTGEGIAPEHIGKVFERFYRVDAARQQTGESGLGLPIAKSLVEMHGGTITVASEIGKGTIFTIRLPQSLPKSATIA